MLKGSIKTDENLLLEPQQTENRKRKINLKSRQLPLRKKKKPFTKRFGESRYIKEKASNININKALDLKKYWEEIAELVLDEEDQEDKEDSVSSNKHQLDAFKNVSTLDDREVSLILKGNMLNDTVIQFFQSLFDRINGLQDPLLGQRLSFKVARNPFIQKLRNRRCHWVKVSTFGCDPGEINYYDSLLNGKITGSVRKQICNLLHPKEKAEVHVMAGQQQKNNTNCDIYAIYRLCLFYSK